MSNENPKYHPTSKVEIPDSRANQRRQLYDTWVTWDCSLGYSERSRSRVKKIEDDAFQLLLNQNNIFENCQHELTQARCPCANNKTITFCRLCYTVFCEPIDLCLNPEHESTIADSSKSTQQGLTFAQPTNEALYHSPTPTDHDQYADIAFIVTEQPKVAIGTRKEAHELSVEFETISITEKPAEHSTKHFQPTIGYSVVPTSRTHVKKPKKKDKSTGVSKGGAAEEHISYVENPKQKIVRKRAKPPYRSPPRFRYDTSTSSSSDDPKKIDKAPVACGCDEKQAKKFATKSKSLSTKKRDRNPNQHAVKVLHPETEQVVEPAGKRKKGTPSTALCTKSDTSKIKMAVGQDLPKRKSSVHKKKIEVPPVKILYSTARCARIETVNKEESPLKPAVAEVNIPPRNGVGEGATEARKTVPPPPGCEPPMFREDKKQIGGEKLVLPLNRTIILKNHPCDHPPNLPLMLEVMAVVSSGESPNDFYVVRKEDVIKRVHLNDKLSRDASFGLRRYQHGRQDSTVVVIYHNDYRWVRANVLNIFSTGYCSVRLIDYGDEVSVTENELKIPPTYAMELQPFAHRCALNLDPTHLALDPENSDGNSWDPKVMGKLKSIGESSVENGLEGIHGLTFKCTEIYENKCVVDVQIVGRKTTWNQELVNQGLASFKNV